jgi:hypothetical protein
MLQDALRGAKTPTGNAAIGQNSACVGNGRRVSKMTSASPKRALRFATLAEASAIF